MLFEYILDSGTVFRGYRFIVSRRSPEIILTNGIPRRSVAWVYLPKVYIVKSKIAH